MISRTWTRVDPWSFGALLIMSLASMCQQDDIDLGYLAAPFGLFGELIFLILLIKEEIHTHTYVHLMCHLNG